MSSEGDDSWFSKVLVFGSGEGEAFQSESLSMGQGTEPASLFTDRSEGSSVPAACKCQAPTG